MSQGIAYSVVEMDFGRGGCEFLGPDCAPVR